jgi:hypothetical protein
MVVRDCGHEKVDGRKAMVPDPLDADHEASGELSIAERERGPHELGKHGP